MGIEFKNIDEELEKETNDKDINYIIEVPTNGILKPLNRVMCFFYLHKEDFSCNLLGLNIYSLTEKDNLEQIYSLINSINFSNSMGSFVVFEDKKIIYKSSINCGLDFNEISKDLIATQIIRYTSELEKLYKKMSSKKDK